MRLVKVTARTYYSHWHIVHMLNRGQRTMFFPSIHPAQNAEINKRNDKRGKYIVLVVFCVTDQSESDQVLILLLLFVIQL